MKGGRRRPPNVAVASAAMALLWASMKGGRRRPPNVVGYGGFELLLGASMKGGRRRPPNSFVMSAITSTSCFNEGRPAPAAEFVACELGRGDGGASMKGGRRRPPNNRQYQTIARQ